MSVSFLTNITEEEFKIFLRQAIQEILSGNGINQKPAEREIMDIKQAADFLRLKITTIYEKTSEKTIPHFKKGNKLLFNRSELQAWVQEGKVKTTEELQGEAATYTLHRDFRKSGAK
jgi:excisionase family DNA binding protein